MKPWVLLGSGALVILAGVGVSGRLSAPEAGVVFEPRNKPREAAPICPWRDPERDLKALFPEATHTRLETHILSARRIEIAQQLGTNTGGDDLILRRYRVYQGESELGAIVTRRVKGRHGAIEIVVATGRQCEVRGVLVQRQREPEAIAGALRDPEWLTSLAGNRAASDWRDYPRQLSAGDRDAADAILGGVRATLILLEMADRESAAKAISATPHH